MQFLIDVALSFLYLGAFLLLCAWAWRFWMMYVNQKFLNEIKWLMLEIKLPREINKSPFAMETALLAFLQGGGIGDWYAKHFTGNLPITSSLEIASIEGVIHFYVRIQSKFKTLVESSLYAQYPGIEIVEAEDYTGLVKYEHLGDVGAWGATYPLGASWSPTNPETGEKYKDPKDKKKTYTMSADFLPLKTYVDYGLDKDPKEEHKIDPLTQLLEFMGSVGKGEHVWYQILLQDEGAYKKFTELYVNDITHEHMSVAKMAADRKKQLRTSHHVLKGTAYLDDYGDPKEKRSGEKDADGKDKMIPALYKETKAVGKKEIELLPEEKEEIEAINKKLSKPLVSGIIRLMYLSEKGTKFQTGAIFNILSFGKPFSNTVWNKFGLSPTDPYDFPWQDPGKKRNKWRTEEKFEAYVEREGFFPHVPASDSKKAIDRMEDRFFWSSSFASKKMFRMIYEVIFHPFSHPTPTEVSTFNLEEIATLWHFPGQVANIPTLPRIDSAKGVAPVNLPQ
jgi:hypothetical protein